MQEGGQIHCKILLGSIVNKLLQSYGFKYFKVFKIIGVVSLWLFSVNVAAQTATNQTVIFNQDTTVTAEPLDITIGGGGAKSIDVITFVSPAGIAPVNADGQSRVINGHTVTFHNVAVANALVTFDVTPQLNSNGTFTFTYNGTNSKESISGNAIVTFSIKAVNDAPVATSGTLTVVEQTPGTMKWLKKVGFISSIKLGLFVGFSYLNDIIEQSSYGEI